MLVDVDAEHIKPPREGYRHRWHNRSSADTGDDIIGVDDDDDQDTCRWHPGFYNGWCSKPGLVYACSITSRDAFGVSLRADHPAENRPVPRLHLAKLVLSRPGAVC